MKYLGFLLKVTDEVTDGVTDEKPYFTKRVTDVTDKVLIPLIIKNIR